MFKTHLVAYTATTSQGTVQGVARVRTDRTRPSWQDCHKEIDGFVTGSALGVEPEYTVRHENENGVVERVTGAAGVERVGRVLMRCADRGTVWNIAVFDADGEDVTLDFACFRD